MQTETYDDVCKKCNRKVRIMLALFGNRWRHIKEVGHYPGCPGRLRNGILAVEIPVSWLDDFERLAVNTLFQGET